MTTKDPLSEIEALIEAGVPTPFIMDVIRSEFAKLERRLNLAETIRRLNLAETMQSFVGGRLEPKPTPPVTPPLPPPKPHHNQKYDGEFLRTKLHSGWLSRKLFQP